MVPDEERLVPLARNGDLGAFNQLVEHTQAVVYNVCLRMLQNADQAADATQEAYFSAYRAMRTYRGGSFRAWLLRIASNQCYDALRRRKREPAISLDESFERPDPGPDPEERALSREVRMALERAISQLPPDQRLCLLLIDAQGLDYQEAAEAMNINLGTVKSRLSRARTALRELIPPEFRPHSDDKMTGGKL